MSDITKKISSDYDVLIKNEGIALRGLFIIDPKGVVRQKTINDLPVGRSVDETLRLIQAIQHFEEHGEGQFSVWEMLQIVALKKSDLIVSFQFVQPIGAVTRIQPPLNQTQKNLKNISTNNFLK